MLIGATLGGEDPLRPIPRGSFATASVGGALGAARRQLEFREIATVAELDAALTEARAARRPVMLDFTAEWCVSCKEMEAHTFPDSDVIAALEPFMLLRADVTENNDDDQALLKRFKSFGPPTIAFFDAAGGERENFKRRRLRASGGIQRSRRAARGSLRIAPMAKARPALLTAALSGAAVLGYLAYRAVLGPAEPRPRRRSNSAKTAAAEEEEAQAAAPQLAERLPEFSLDTLAGHRAIDLKLARQAAAHQLLGDLVRAVPARDPDAQGVPDRHNRGSRSSASPSTAASRSSTFADTDAVQLSRS